MRTIGIRVSPKCIFYCVCEKKSDQVEIVNVDKIIVPVKMDIQFQLRHIKTNVISILKEYDITKVGIRATENNARSISIPRVYMEGVIIETLADSSVQGFYIGTINKIASLLNEESKMIKQYVNNTINFKNIKGWDKFSAENRESIMTAYAAYNL